MKIPNNTRGYTYTRSSDQKDGFSLLSPIFVKLKIKCVCERDFTEKIIE